MSEFYLIKRGLYYRPNAEGYTADIAEAGHFTEEYARSEVLDTNGDVFASPVPSYVPSIVSAAMLMDDGLIVPGVRHFSPDMRAVLHRIYGDGYHLRVKEQGFIDAKGIFLTREDAHVRAKALGQIKHHCGGNETTLYSESIY